MPPRLSQERNVRNVLYEPLEINHCNDDPESITENIVPSYDNNGKLLGYDDIKAKTYYPCGEGQQHVAYKVPTKGSNEKTHYTVFNAPTSAESLYAFPVEPNDPYKAPAPLRPPSYVVAAPGSSNSGYSTDPGYANVSDSSSSRYAKIDGGKFVKRSTLKRARATRKGMKKNNKKRLTRRKKNKNKRRFTRK